MSVCTDLYIKNKFRGKSHYTVNQKYNHNLFRELKNNTLYRCMCDRPSQLNIHLFYKPPPLMWRQLKCLQKAKTECFQDHIWPFRGVKRKRGLNANLVQSWCEHRYEEAVVDVTNQLVSDVRVGNLRAVSKGDSQTESCRQVLIHTF